MDITKIDKNFAQTEITQYNGQVLTMPCKPFTLYGGWFEDGIGFIKVPLDKAEKVSPGVLWGSRCTAGVRILFSTNAKIFKLTAKLFAKCLMHHMALTGSSGFTLTEVVGQKEVFVGNFMPSLNVSEQDFTAQVNLKGEIMRNYILYFPLYCGVQSLSFEFDNNACFAEFKKYNNEKPILYYGSSITQGGCASRPDNCYQGFISEWLNMDYLLLGYSGSAKAEDEMIDYLASVDCSVFVCDYDHNASTVQDLKNTHEKLFKAFRANPKHKNVPVVFVSRPDGNNEIGALRFEVIKQTYQNALNNGDKNVYLVDGREFYPKDIMERCAVDSCHPTDLGFYFMARGIYSTLKQIFK